MNLDRLGSITSELSSNLLKSIVVPQGGLLGWLTRPRERPKSTVRPDDGSETSMAEFPAGPVVLLGGAPVPDEAVVESIHLAGGRAIKMAVIPVAAVADPAASAAEATRLFTRFGMKKVELFPLDSREKAASPEWCEKLAGFDAVLLCGESPAQALQVLQATLAAVTLGEMVKGGKLLIGLDGAAAALGSRAFPSGEAEAFTTGLGILPGLLLETGAPESSAPERLLQTMAAPEAAQMLGVRLDLGSALVLSGGEAKVLGESAVTFHDPRQGGAGVQRLTEGFRINLRARRVMAPQALEVANR